MCLHVRKGFSELESSVRVALSKHLALIFKWDNIAALCAEWLVGCSSLYMPYLCSLPEGLMEVPQESRTSVWMSGHGCQAMPWSVLPGPQGRPGKVGTHLGHCLDQTPIFGLKLKRALCASVVANDSRGQAVAGSVPCSCVLSEMSCQCP